MRLKLLSLAKRISAINATIRRFSQSGSRRDEEAGAQALAANDLHDPVHNDNHCSSSVFTSDSILVIPLSFTVDTLHRSADTLYDPTPTVEVVSDSSSEYFTDSASTVHSSVFERRSYLTAQEFASVKAQVMDPLSAQASEVESSYPSAEQRHSIKTATAPLQEDAQYSESVQQATLYDAEAEAPLPEPVNDPLQSMPSEYDTKDDALLGSPPPIHLEPEVPDPFIVDDGEDSDEDRGSDEAGLAESATPSAAADEEIALAQSILIEPSIQQDPSTPVQAQYPVPVAPITSPFPSKPSLFSLQPNVNKEMPSLPSAPSSEEDEEETPELYLPGLVLPTMFLPIPNVRFIALFYELELLFIVLRDGIRRTLSARC
ncbi:hypothetical protein NM688_g7650 [Phlebia brevispora]|uniref:Uncharacterized protein n=1 Tax=Phlebia brevispora TaxID=194682 RepID=A0ACC1S2S5_9APHY|nr:hypothetical protein NM688_g7650 [Phlebia brevispora]